MIRGGMLFRSRRLRVRGRPIALIEVAEGDQVGAGDVLAVLDNLAQLQRSIASARADIAVREAILSQTRASITASRNEARATLERAEATAAAAQSDLDRTTSLFERGVVTRADFDQIVTRATEAGRDVERGLATCPVRTGSESVQADIAVAKADWTRPRLIGARRAGFGTRLCARPGGRRDFKHQRPRRRKAKQFRHV